MVEITESFMITKEVAANEVYHIKYTRGHSTSIYNAAEGDIYVNTVNDFDGESKMLITSGTAFNNLKTSSTQDIYIKTSEGASGKITLIRDGFC